MNNVNEQLELALESASEQEMAVALSRADLAFNAMLDVVVDWVDKWIVTPLLGVGPAID
jgi:hypothetical protein